MTLRFKEDTNMNEPIISEILQDMLPVLDNSQLAKLKGVLEHKLWNAEIVYKTVEDSFDKSNEEFTELFISAKRVEGCSLKTLRYYLATINKMTNTVGKHITKITTEDLRKYLSDYHEENNCSKSNIDNIRRILSSFFSWLEDEDYILKSPVRRIHKIKSAKTVKETYTDEMLEYMRDNCDSLRDLAIIDMLASTGMRVGDDDDKIRLNQRKPSKYKGLSRFGPEKNLQRINKFMKERPIFYKNLIQMKENFRFYLRCFYCITKVVILQFNSENRTELARNG